MANFNKVILMGNLTRDPEVRYTPKGQRSRGTRHRRQSHLHRRERGEARRSHFRRRDALGTHGGNRRRVSEERAARFSSKDGCSSILGKTSNPVKSATSSRWSAKRCNCSAVAPAAAGGGDGGRRRSASLAHERRSARRPAKDGPPAEPDDDEIPF